MCYFVWLLCKFKSLAKTKSVQKIQRCKTPLAADISATVAVEMLEKYKLKANDAILTEEEAIFKDIQDNYKVSKIIIIDNYIDVHHYGQIQCSQTHH